MTNVSYCYSLAILRVTHNISYLRCELIAKKLYKQSFLSAEYCRNQSAVALKKLREAKEIAVVFLILLIIWRKENE